MEIVYTLIKEIEKYHAHVAEDKEKEITRRELLTEHIDCTMKYFEELARERLGLVYPDEIKAPAQQNHTGG